MYIIVKCVQYISNGDMQWYKKRFVCNNHFYKT